MWPFSRKNKRHTIQISASEAGGIQYEAGPSFNDTNLGRKPSRKHSKRQKNRHLQPIEDSSTLSSQPSPTYPPHTSHTEQIMYPAKGTRDASLWTDRQHEAHTSHSSASHYQQPPVTRTASLLRSKRNENGPAVLKKKLSKRKAYEIAREQEIRLMVSSPIDIPRQSTGVPGERCRSAQNRRLDGQFSDVNLSVRGSAASSSSDFSEAYTFKVNSLAAWTPRPIIRYVEAPRLSTAKSQKSVEALARSQTVPSLSISKENLRSKKRVDTLADNLDASALRELLERDRRRKEKQRIEDQERLQRRLESRAERQTIEEELGDASHDRQNKNLEISHIQRGRSGAENLDVESDRVGEAIPSVDETKAFLSGDASSSWLRDASNERSHHESPESVHAVGNLDDSSVQKHELAQRPSFAPSQEMGMSHSTWSRSHSPSRHGISTPTSSQIYGVARASTPDVARTIESERRLSDQGRTRGNTLTSLIRRGSSRLKRTYRERFHDESSGLSNTSHESFFRVSTQSSGLTPYIPPKAFLGPGTIKRSQSKFTEHFGDEPLSPPDSRLQSPDIPEEPSDQSKVEDLNVGAHYPIPGSEPELHDAQRSRHRSWANDSLEYEAENVPLSQSLASIDSEGSWMSGQFLRRISQRTSNPLRHSVSLSQNRAGDEQEGSFKGDEISGNEQFVRFGPNNDDPAGASNDVIEEEEKDYDMIDAPDQEKETWHTEIAKRPVLVNPTVRPKSNEGLLLKNMRPLSPMAAEEAFCPIEEYSAELHSTSSDDYEHVHAQ